MFSPRPRWEAIYAEGVQGVIEKDYPQALMWFIFAAAQGDMEAMEFRDNLANRMTPTQITEAQRLAREFKPQDVYTKSLQEFKALAEQGDAAAQFKVGLIYYKGQGVPPDYPEALNWFKKAALQGHPMAQYNAGYMYEKGEGTPQDYVEAAKYYRRAAERGNQLAQYNLGYMYEKGQGVSPDEVAGPDVVQSGGDPGGNQGQSGAGPYHRMDDPRADCRGPASGARIQDRRKIRSAFLWVCEGGWVMRKCSRLSGLFLCILTLCVCSCGISGSVADPMGTGTVTLTADATEVQPGGSCTLTATVTNQTGEGTTVPVIGERVSFSLLTANGGTLAAASDRTGSGGVATAIYTAGNNMASDTVRVTTDVGATASITITKTGGIVGARISSLAASSTTVAADQTTVVTATVTDGNSNPMQGETVTFTLPVNESGARFVSASGAGVSSIPVTTDAAGNAVAVYFAGSNNPLTAVYDTVRATLANGSSNSVVITRSAGTARTGYSITITTAAPTVPRLPVAAVSSRQT